MSVFTNTIVIVGAGPAGIAAAVAASQSKAEVILIDDNPTSGGQIWRNSLTAPWSGRLAKSSAKIFNSTRVLAADPSHKTLLIERDNKPEQLSYSKLILATGARELFLPFPGWTLPNILGVGGLQALVKSGLPIARKRVVVSGSGPLLLAVTAYLEKCGATVSFIAEQASFASLTGFARELVRHPAKLWQAATLLPGSRYKTSCWIEAAFGDTHVNRVRLRHKEDVWDERCDYVANAYGFVPNTELAIHIGCTLENGFVKVDSSQATSVPNVYCAGEPVGIGGVDTALLEGQIAGHAATGQSAALDSQLRKAKSFARALNEAFAVRPELKTLAKPQTIVCRCEDVTLERLRTAASWRAAKLHERCGMGPCQGRICGPAAQFILGWEPSSVRPPIFPSRLETLLQENSAS